MTAEEILIEVTKRDIKQLKEGINITSLEALRAMEQYRKEGLMDFMNFLENKLIDIVCDNDEQGKEYLIKEYLKQKP